MKAPEKPKVPRQRRTSKAVPPTTHVAPASVSEPAPSPAKATPSPSENRLKRPREEEAMVQSTSTVVPRNVASDEVPSKRMKGELAEAPEAELPNRQVEAESIKTTPQAPQFYCDMTQILELSNNSALLPDLRETLAQLVETRAGH